MSDKKTRKLGQENQNQLKMNSAVQQKKLKNNSTIQKKNIVLVIENKFHNSGKKSVSD